MNSPVAATEPNERMWRRLRFGIPSLDQLISGESEYPGIDLASADKDTFDTTSICIIGPDGTGKSVLALHLASYYAVDHYSPGKVMPKVLYVSTDLRYEKAHKVWKNFLLNDPLNRRIPFYTVNPQTRPVLLTECVPGKPQKPGQKSLSRYLYHPPSAQDEIEIAFVNLAANTAGDDWGYINRILATMETPPNTMPSNLIILDAVEGLEMLVGDRDAFGEERSRRSRVAQLMRAAGEKSHVVLIVEEANEDIRLPEDYVTDVVLRLRSVEIEAAGRHYLRRTVEVEKARAQPHIRGHHPFTIRSGEGSSTGSYYNPDDPLMAYKKDAAGVGGITYILPAEVKKRKDNNLQVLYTSYVQVFHSLHYINRTIMQSPARGTEGPSNHRFAGFGIPFLDNMLNGKTKPDDPPSATPSDLGEYDQAECDGEGLPCGSVTALIGENGTHRTRLSYAFLSQCFKEGRNDHIAILITTHDIDSGRLAVKLAAHLDKDTVDQRWVEETAQRIICRRLEVHDLSSAILFHIMRQAIQEARRRLDDLTVENTTERHTDGYKIRVVIGNLAVMRATYPDVADDPLFLPALNFWLMREGVTALLLHTDAGGPDTSRHSDFTRVLCGEIHGTLYQWHVPFFGEDRIAIAAIPAISDNRPSVTRELRAAPDKNGGRSEDRLYVDPHFEMYTGLLERETPRLIPLVVRLWSGAEQFHRSHFAQLNAMLMEVFANTGTSGDIISAPPDEQYEDLRRASHLKGDMRLDYTLVLQVDEFWYVQRRELLPMDKYLQAKTTTTPEDDPYRTFQFTQFESNGPLPQKREDFFYTRGFDYKSARKNSHTIDRVPYLWDFGFLLLRESSWNAAREKRLILDYEHKPEDTCTIGAVWDSLKKTTLPRSGTERSDGSPRIFNPVSWRVFLHACSVVARAETNEDIGHPYAFDIHMISPQTFCCLVLEVWASVIYEMTGSTDCFAKRREETGKEGLIALLEKHMPAFFRTWFLLGEVFSPAQFGVEWIGFPPRPAHPGAVAVRHWYSTATFVQDGRPTKDPLTPVRLPGHYSVRGDWFLAIASGSRSPLLGEHAIDLLSSRRANILRLQAGLGLPTRKITNEETLDDFWTRLYRVEEFGKKIPITYGELLNLAAREEEGEKEDRDNFFWLWRYSMPGYDRQVTVFSKMLSLLLSQWQNYWRLVEQEHKYRFGFEAYDRWDWKDPNIKKDLGYREFSKECDSWIRSLMDATNKDGA